MSKWGITLSFINQKWRFWLYNRSKRWSERLFRHFFPYRLVIYTYNKSVTLDVYELWIMPQHKQRDWTNPQRISLIPLYEWLILHLIGTTAKKWMLWKASGESQHTNNHSSPCWIGNDTLVSCPTRSAPSFLLPDGSKPANWYGSENTAKIRNF